MDIYFFLIIRKPFWRAEFATQFILTIRPVTRIQNWLPPLTVLSLLLILGLIQRATLEVDRNRQCDGSQFLAISLKNLAALSLIKPLLCFSPRCWLQNILCHWLDVPCKHGPSSSGHQNKASQLAESVSILSVTLPFFA